MSAGKSTEHCTVCGTKLDYRDRGETLTCSYCGRQEEGHISCSRGHYLCNDCHGRNIVTLIEDFCRTTTLKDPMEIAELLMGHPGLPMLGCEHAYITAGALLAALRNSPYGKSDADIIGEAFLRTGKQAHGGYCGLTGVCGVTPAAGAVFSVFLGARCGTDREQNITMEAATRVSRAITGRTGPSCCKAYVRAAIPVAVSLFQERFGIILPLREPAVCMHSAKHPHGCREEKCPHFRREPSRDIFIINRAHSVCGPT